MIKIRHSDTLDTTEVYTEKELSKAVYDSIKYYHKRANDLLQENEKLKKHALEMANDELIDTIQSLRERLDLSYGEFSSQKERDAYKDFEKRHMHDRMTSKYNGGRAPYLIPTGVGIGTHLEVVCPICGEKEDITDTEVW